MSFAAAVAEVTVSAAGEVRVERLWCAHDCGRVINPDRVRAQCEGNLIWGQAMVLNEHLRVRDGAPSGASFTELPLPRLGDVGAIALDPGLFAFRYVPAKAQSVLVRQARDLATSKGHPPDVAEAMIDKNVVLFRKKGNGGKGSEFRSIHIAENSELTPTEAASSAIVKGDCSVCSMSLTTFATFGCRAVILEVAIMNCGSDPGRAWS